ncbi:MAG TPA: general secretion pathway protein GspE, partial [Kosmotoga arenicorallina]|nr:general secretion pathway protein GspE [Kosmotoga arenicorallina]
MRVYKRLGELLLERGFITPGALQQAVSIQQKVGKPLGEVLVGMGLISWEDIYTALSDQYGIELMEEVPNLIPTELLKMIPKSVAERLRVIPVEYLPEENTLVVITTEVLKVPQIQKEISFLTGHKVKVYLTTPPLFDNLFHSSYEETTSSEIIEHTFEVEEEDLTEEETEESVEDTPIVKFINSMLDNAIKSDASDIHLEPYEKLAVARFRVDGVLRKILTYPKKAHNSVVSRIKVMCGLDISERRLPQDGKFFLRRGGGEQYDFRVSTMPTVHGEKIVMRILKVSNAKKQLDELGLSDYNFKRFERLLKAPHGIILISGPTGSGKSTTLVG